MTLMNFLDEKSYKHFIEKESVVLLEFWAAWCGPCKMMSPVLDDISVEMDKVLRTGKINIDECNTVAEGFNIRSIPTTILIKDKTEIARFIGYMAKNELKQKIDEKLK